MKLTKTLVALLVLLTASWLAVATAQEAPPPQAPASQSTLPPGDAVPAGTPFAGPNGQQVVEPTPAMREALYHKVWQQIADEYIDPSKLQDWDKLATKYNGKLNSDEDLDAAITELVQTVGDRWTKYQSLKTTIAHKQMEAQGMVQAGVIIRRHADGKWHIDNITWGSPAFVSGLKEGDVVTAVNGKPVADKLDEYQAWDIFLGQPGDTMMVTAVYDGQEHQVQMTLTPPIQERVTLRMLPSNVLYIRLPTFVDVRVVEDFLNQLRRVYMQQKGDVTGVVFDLRNNSGGLFDMALKVTSLFLESGNITKTTERDGISEKVIEYNVTAMPPFAKRLMTDPHMVDFINWAHNTPLVVLINGSSASASEVTTGALQDNKRAFVIGEQSFGKSVGFRDTELPNRAILQITTMKYLTPSGRDILDKGITPDQVVVQPRQGSTEDLALKAAHEYIVKLATQRFNQVQDGRNIAGKSHQELEHDFGSQAAEQGFFPTFFNIVAAVVLVVGYLLISNRGRRLLFRGNEKKKR